MTLTLVHSRDYARPVAAKSAIGIGVPYLSWPHRPQNVVRGFFVRAVQHPSYGRLDGGLFGGAGPQGSRYANAVQSPALIGVQAGGVDLIPRSRVMANPTQVTPEAFDLAVRAYDTVNLAVSTLYDLSAIFRAIHLAEELPSHNKRLAGVGQYLADDWGGLLDSQLSELKALLDAVREGRAAA